MCLACDWGKYFAIRESEKTIAEKIQDSFSRRRMLQAGVAFAATGVASLLEGTPVGAQPASATSGKADLIFHNGPVYTVNGPQAWARAVAVQGKHITYVGDEAGVQAFVGPATRMVDLEGKMLLPGFVEGHIHPLIGAAITRGIDLQYDTREQTLKVLEAYRAKAGKVDVVRGFGWRYSAFPATGPRKEDLDRIWPDTPVILFAIDAHSAWVNSKALQMAGVTNNTKDPMPGFSFYQRDRKTGEATGWLVEVPVEIEVLNAVAPFQASFIAHALEEWLPMAAAAGVTTVFDAGVQIMPEEDAFELYTGLERQGKLPFRVIGCTYHNNPAIDPVPVIQDLRRRFNSELVQASVLKLNIDGGDAQHTAALLKPYNDKPNTSGDTLLPGDLFKDIVRRADREGINIHVHSFGDRATRLSLDAIEAAITANPPRDRRHTLAHLVLVDSDDLPRFAKLGVVAQFSAQWAVPDDYWLKTMNARIGAMRAKQAYRMGSILRHGGTISLGTDWPAAAHFSTFRPLDAIEIAVTRQELNKPRQTALAPADERVSLTEALRANTLGAAYQLGLEHRVGSIEVGKLADLVVLEKNLFEVPPDQIHTIKVIMTIMDGKVRHQSVM
jgi:predicted amidohydrolase YtcJ